MKKNVIKSILDLDAILNLHGNNVFIFLNFKVRDKKQKVWIENHTWNSKKKSISANFGSLRVNKKTSAEIKQP
jgi:hypothetical protein